ncbi:hypothetical protein [Companilactobacillus bobalius]|nr:hypothetical protein [Companilactobacillus bobalius]OVE96528.1 hypothetical protein LKACC16343_02195 [Companilactobacillus bobalius]GEO58497.1 hypothetical protein LBO01_16260 [Companilactobacillus paralimentarius]
MNSKQYEAVVEYLKNLSPFDDDELKEEDAYAGAENIDEILKEYADE